MTKLADKIWFNGQIINWEDAQIHVMTHALHYGTSVFEGIRCYDTPNGPVGFRLSDHLRRLEDSARIYGIKIPFDLAQMVKASKDIIVANNLKSAYWRPIAFLGECGMGVTPKADKVKVDLAIAAFPWGAYLGEEGLAKGVDVCISSWNRAAPNTIPVMAKAGGNYLSSYLIGKEARDRGYVEGIGLGVNGLISEGAGENLFVMMNGKIYTPPVAASILGGITRDSVIRLAKADGIEVLEQDLPREMLYLADEIFMTGTAAEITPIRSVDDIPTRVGGPGKITKRLQTLFHGLFNGTTEDRFGWLEPIEAKVPAE
ncbi:branched-chain amino acid aminotransferase [Asticcacaulis biprosthecium C19]|uniref:Branched-chain-amino-acid aminotransferase n=1 Tax=Asticcacaulis biprosthecium C19 TaxID=715226 RepID=F4QMD0_9CAUL|nr:branched-chain amino acid transaminase [Asticcacaulis biprosthecium]EGF91371.1 branched-chain amino acid aminotransferase [Asticcacaulis biprosthecium C19]